jgi:hypothetical protein
VGAKHARLVLALSRLEVEGVLHRPRRVVLRHVERGEIIPLALDLGAFCDREAEVRENLGQLVHHLADRVHRPARPGLDRKRQIDPLGRELAVELGVLEHGLALGKRRRNPLAPRVDLGRLRRACVGVHRPERLEQRGDAARLAERGDAQRLKLLERAGSGDLVEQGVGHAGAP